MAPCSKDRDGDGTLKDGDHHRLSGWTVYLDKDNSGTLTAGDPTTTSDSHGNYRFSGLVAGTYHVREIVQSGWNETYPKNGKYDITLAAGKISKKNDFGNYKPGVISGTVFNDQNGNHRKDAGEPGLSGWTIKITGPHGFSSSAISASNGGYSFGNLLSGWYFLSETKQSGWYQTVHPYPVYVQSGTNAINRNFGDKQGLAPHGLTFDQFTD